MAESPAQLALPAAHLARPKLVVFFSARSGRCRRIDSFLAQVLQRRHNHETFDLIRVCVDEDKDTAARFNIDQVPTILVIENRRVQTRITNPPGIPEIEQPLAPWLR